MLARPKQFANLGLMFVFYTFYWGGMKGYFPVDAESQTIQSNPFILYQNVGNAAHGPRARNL